MALSFSNGNGYLFGQRVDAGSHKLWRDVGYLVETPYAYTELTVREKLEIILFHCILKTIYNVSGSEPEITRKE
jgi:ABC-type multidrug transport system ATPase subunit